MTGSPLEELFTQEDEESFEKILLALLDKENISMKTEITRPLNLTRLDTVRVWLEIEKMDKSAKIIETFLLRYQEYMVSNKRKSRQEIIQALTEGIKEERTMTEKLTSKPA